MHNIKNVKYFTTSHTPETGQHSRPAASSERTLDSDTDATRGTFQSINLQTVSEWTQSSTRSQKVTEEQVEGAGPILSWQLLALHPFPPGAAAQGASEGFHLKPFCLCTCETFPRPHLLSSWLLQCCNKYTSERQLYGEH